MKQIIIDFGGGDDTLFYSDYQTTDGMNTDGVKRSPHYNPNNMYVQSPQTQTKQSNEGCQACSVCSIM